MTRETRVGDTCQTARTVRARTRGHVDLRINSHTQSTRGGDDYEMSTEVYLVAGKTCPLTGPSSPRVLEQVNPLWLCQDCVTPLSTFTNP